MSPTRTLAPAVSELAWDDHRLGVQVAAQPLAWRRLTPVAATTTLVLVDVLVFLVSFAVASQIRDSLVGPMQQPLLIWASGAVWLLARACVGLYPGYGLAAP